MSTPSSIFDNSMVLPELPKRWYIRGCPELATYLINNPLCLRGFSKKEKEQIYQDSQDAKFFWTSPKKYLWAAIYLHDPNFGLGSADEITYAQYIQALDNYEATLFASAFEDDEIERNRITGWKKLTQEPVSSKWLSTFEDEVLIVIKTGHCDMALYHVIRESATGDHSYEYLRKEEIFTKYNIEL